MAVIFVWSWCSLFGQWLIQMRLSSLLAFDIDSLTNISYTFALPSLIDGYVTSVAYATCWWHWSTDCGDSVAWMSWVCPWFETLPLSGMWGFGPTSSLLFWVPLCSFSCDKVVKCYYYWTVWLSAVCIELFVLLGVMMRCYGHVLFLFHADWSFLLLVLIVGFN